ncbi:DoxX family protein [Nocardioides sambongensis]|uniref:DoxX family protein n=1 Tax=Nocardioides sambongensis TaxID=2589074 RepID=UPI00112B7458|nr:DoxX family protein [Nocardioides sambongensis]
MSTTAITDDRVPHTARSAARPHPQVVAGRIITALASAFLAFDATTHLARETHVMEFNAEIGAPAWFPVVCGAVLAVCLVGYLVPRTRAMGTILLTAYLGGACAINLATAATTANVVFAVAMAVLVWAGAWPRDARLRALLQN